jgi:hypothetical protein
MMDARNQFKSTHATRSDALGKSHVVHVYPIPFDNIVYFSHSLSMIYVKSMETAEMM